jgi:hypothetical protein
MGLHRSLFFPGIRRPGDVFDRGDFENYAILLNKAELWPMKTGAE